MTISLRSPHAPLIPETTGRVGVESAAMAHRA